MVGCRASADIGCRASADMLAVSVPILSVIN